MTDTIRVTNAIRLTPADIIVEPEFASHIPPLRPEEFTQLEANILEFGCLDPLVVWRDYVGTDEYSDDPWLYFLLDGHNRLAICEEHNIPFEVTYLEFNDKDEAEDWIDANQLGRRNLTPDQMSVLRGRRYNRLKRAQGGTGANQYGEQTRQNVGSATAGKLASEHGVTSRTIERDGKLVQDIDKLKAIDPDLETRVISGKGPPKSTVNFAADLVKKDPEMAQKVLSGEKKLADAKREVRRRDTVARLEDIEAQQAKELEGVYDVVVIDPPWPMQKIERDVRPNQTEFDYPTMSEDELAALEIPCDEDAHVWVWTTHKFLPMALRLLEAWGLKYVCTFVWHKPGGFQPIGLPQYNCEFALYARSGSPEFIDTKAFPTCFEAPRGKHSEKPEEFYDVVRRVTAGRRLDMFNRRAIEGFDGWGNEAAS